MTQKASKNENDSLVNLFKGLKEEDFTRGSPPAGIEQRCLSLCQTYIGGSWNNAHGDQDIEVTRVAGGLTNQLFRTRLRETVPRVEYNPIYPQHEPLDVAIKFYMPKRFKSFHEDDAERLNDILVLTITSQEGIGPKVYGIFNDGMIQDYHENESFRLKYQQQPDKVRQLAHLLARVHHLNVPIRKNHDWDYPQINSLFSAAYEERNAAQLIQEHCCNLLKSHDPRKELKDLFDLIKDLNSPFVFCHNDCRSANILVTKPDQRIFLVDFEYSAFGYRGRDLACFLNEWGIDAFDARFDYDVYGLPEQEIMENFVRLYIEGCDLVVPGFSKRPENSVKQIVKEVKLSSLAFSLFLLGFMMQTTANPVPNIPFDPVTNIKYCEGAYKKYFHAKERFIRDGTIPKQ